MVECKMRLLSTLIMPVISSELTIAIIKDSFFKASDNEVKVCKVKSYKVKQHDNIVITL